MDGEGAAKAAENLDKLVVAAQKAEIEMAKVSAMSKDLLRLSIEQAKAESSKFRAQQAAHQVENSLIRERMQAERIAFKHKQDQDNLSLSHAKLIAAEARARIALIKEQATEEKRLFDEQNNRLRLEAQLNRTARSRGSPPALPTGTAPSGVSRWSLAPEVTFANARASLGPIAGPIAGALAGQSMLNTIVEMETLQARLLSVTGSAERANAAFEKLKILDRQLPHDIAELTNAFTLLIHSGFEPSERALRSISALSSYSTEDVNDVVIAMQRATMGEFRNLKKYGVAAEAFGDQVRFTFNGMTEVVNRNSVAIQEYFMRLSEQGTFMNASANKMATLAGSISNLESAWKSFMDSSSENGGIGFVLKTLIEGLTMVLDGMDMVIGGMTKIGANFFEGISWVIEGDLDKAAESMKNFAKYAAMPGLAMADYAEDKARLAAKAKLEGLQSPAAIAKAKEDAWKAQMSIIKGEMDARKELRDLKLQFDSEEARLEAQGADRIAEIWNNANLSSEEKQKFHAKVLEEHALKIAKIREDSESKIKKQIEESKKESEKVVSFRSGLLSNEEDAVMDAYRKREEEIKSFIDISGDQRAELERLSWDKTKSELIKIASERKNEFHRIYEDEVEQATKEHKAKKTSYEQYLRDVAAAEERYRTNVGGIMVQGGTRFTPGIKQSELKLGDATDASDVVLRFQDKRKQLLEEHAQQSKRLWADPEQTAHMVETQAKMDEELKRNLQAYDDSELSRKQAAYQAEMEALEEQYFNVEGKEDEHLQKRRELHQRYQDDVGKISAAGNRLIAVQNLQAQAQVLGMAGTIASQLDTLAQGNSDAAKATFFATKAIAIAQALINTHLGATQALAMGPYGIPMATYITGLGYASVALMAATSFQEYAGKFADGGIVPGTSLSGDNLVARVNSGEMILNSGQQKNLFDMASRGGMGGGITVNVYNEAGVEVETQTREDGKTIDLIIKRVKSELASDAKTGKSALVSTLEQTHGIRRRGA